MVDDVELVNTERVAQVVENARTAFRLRLAEREREGTKGSERHCPLCGSFCRGDLRASHIKDLVRHRCSFHLLSPMVEAYFFGEPTVLTRAGVRRRALRHPGDVESFCADDPEYRQWLTERYPGDSHRHRFSERHPKHYLSFLCEPDFYQETRNGKAALECLDWGMVLAPTGEVRLAHSLFDDLADAFGCTDPCPGECTSFTERKYQGDWVLRNL